MAILVNAGGRRDQWRLAFEEELPDEDLRWWPEIGDPAEIEFVIAWRLPREAWEPLVGLKAIFSLGAGTEQWQEPGVPEVPVVRLADPAMSDEMAAYAVSWIVRHHRRFEESREWQRQREWVIPDGPQTAAFRVGILGHGTIGARIGRAFSGFGYPVNAWTRSPHDTPGVTAYVGADALDAFLAASDAVVNVLPSTTSTIGLLTTERFGRMPSGSIFVNVGRGDVLASDDQLITALDDGPLGAAVLDVTEPEPPEPDSPLWDHPAVTLTAHLSGTTQIRSGAELIAANIRRMRAGEAPFPVLDRSRGY